MYLTIVNVPTSVHNSTTIHASIRGLKVYAQMNGPCIVIVES